MKNTKLKTQDLTPLLWVAVGLIVLISTVVYYNSLNTPFIFDDKSKIVENLDIKQLSNTKTKLIYPYDKEHKTFERNDPSRPFTYLTFTLNYYFGKLNPFGYHLFDMLIHIFNSILIFFLTRKIILYPPMAGQPWADPPDRGQQGVSPDHQAGNLFPLLVALFFAAHPINTTTVTYIFARSGQLATFFYLLSLLFFIKSFVSPRLTRLGREGNIIKSFVSPRLTRLGREWKCYYIFSLLSCILSFSSKPIAVTFPAIVLIFDYIFLSNYKIKKVVEKKYYHIPFWIILLGYLLFRYFYLGGIGDVESSAPFKISKYSYLLIQFNIIIRYLKLLLIPAGLCFEHSIRLPKTIFEFRILASFFFYIGIFLLAWKLYKEYRGKTNISKIMLFCILWFFITLSPTSSFFPTTLPMDEKRMYLSGFGFYLAIVFIYFLIFSRGSTLKTFSFLRGGSFVHKHSRVLLILIGIHISLLGVITIKRNQLFQNPVLVWQDVISKYPGTYRAHNGLGLLYKDQKEYARAIQEFQKAIEINPDYIKAHINLGNLLCAQKDYTKGIQEFRKVLEINPDYVEAHSNLGNLWYVQKEYAKAIEKYQKALEINPDHADAHYNLGVVYRDQKEYTKAIQKFQKAININPDYAKAHNNLGLLYYDQKEYAKAIQEFQKVVKINPRDVKARNNLGILYYNQKEYTKAIQEYQKAIEINPDFIETHNNLGLLYYSRKEYRKALQKFEFILKINPYDENVKNKIKTLKTLYSPLQFP